MKTRQFIILIILIIIGFGLIGFQNYSYHKWDKKTVDVSLRANNHEHQLIMEKLGN